MDMRRTLALLLLALLAGAGTALPAAAGGDFYDPGLRGSLNPYGVATPVPAPIPVPVYEAAWYLRADFAASFGGDPGITTAGTPYGTGTALQTIGLNAAWLSESFEPGFTGGVGVGYVWGPAFRTDFTVDIHSISQAKYNGTQSYFDGAAVQTLAVQDKTSFMSTILLLNAYYDIRTGTPFTPYIGGGLGFTVNDASRHISASQAGVTTNASGSTTDVQFAAAAMVGVNWELSSFTSIDVNYRYLYIGGSGTDVTVNGVNSSVDVGSINDHQIRAGFRFSIF
jgi:opacity protein-like surface antigen